MQTLSHNISHNLIKQVVCNDRLYILATVETWLRDTILKQMFVITHEYFIFRNDRGLINLDTGNDIGEGGVVILRILVSQNKNLIPIQKQKFGPIC